MNVSVVSVRHTGTRWLVDALVRMGCTVTHCHTHEAMFDVLAERRPLVIPMRDPVLAKLTSVNRYELGLGVIILLALVV